MAGVPVAANSARCRVISGRKRRPAGRDFLDGIRATHAQDRIGGFDALKKNREPFRMRQNRLHGPPGVTDGPTVAAGEGLQQRVHRVATKVSVARRLPQPRMARVAHSGSTNRVRNTVLSTAFCQKPDSSE